MLLIIYDNLLIDEEFKKMLIEVGMMFAVYGAVRLQEKFKGKKTPKKYKTVKAVQSQTDSKPVTVLDDSDKSHQVAIRNTVADDDTQQTQHYFKVSGVSVGVSAIRQFIYPSLWPVSLGLYIYTAMPLMRQTEKLLIKERRANIEVLYFFGDTITLAISQYFAASFGIWLLYAGRDSLAKAKSESEKMLINVFEQQPNKVWLLRDNVEVEVPLEAVGFNDIVVVNTGEVIPVDGLITEGSATIDQRALTGESQPSEKQPGDQVFASTVIVGGRILVKVEKSGQETTIAKISHILTHSTDFKSRIQLKGEQWADKATLPMLLLSGLVLPIFGPVSTVVFINAHNGELVRIFAPLGTVNHLALASHKGILVKDGRALEELIKVDTVLFDKTGTLTDEQPQVGQIIVCDNFEADEILTYAAAAERKFAHPIAKAILQKALKVNLSLPEIGDSKYQMGHGITVNLEDNIMIRVGSSRFMTQEGLLVPEIIKKAQANAHEDGYSLVLVAVNQEIGGAIEIQPQLRPEVKPIISGLRQRGIKHIAIVSGDHKQPTQKLAKELGMDSYFYEVLPQNKAQIVEQLQKEGKSVCFIGDGINDAIAMKKANVSISLRGATSIATDVAEIVLMDGSLSRLGEIFDLAKKLEDNLHKTLALTLMPGVLNLSGAFVLHFGIMTSYLIDIVFSGITTMNAMRPLKEISREKKQ
jgi:heavy metal translocating P-type ATPase